MKQISLIALCAMSVTVCKAQSGGETAQPSEYKIAQERGTDRRVQYSSLEAYGPWDDRNYKLTVEDLKVLASNEHEQRDPIPAFFRVILRRANPGLRKEGVAQYPRNALQIFLAECGGYLINGRLYREVTVKDGRFVVITRDGTELKPGVQVGNGRCDF